MTSYLLLLLEHINGFMSEESAQSSHPLVLLTGLSSGFVLWMITVSLMESVL